MIIGSIKQCDLCDEKWNDTETQTELEEIKLIFSIREHNSSHISYDHLCENCSESIMDVIGVLKRKD